MPPEISVRKPVGFVTDARPLVKVRGGVPSYSDFFKAMNQIVTEAESEWCGIPGTLPGLGLVLEDRHPRAAQVAEMQRIVDGDAPKADLACKSDDLGWRLVNEWWSFRQNGHVMILRHDDGRTTFGILHAAPMRNKMLLGVFDAVDAWDQDAELTAVDTLATHVSVRQFKQYLLTGQFLERSTRSGLHYLFRRLRPTVAFGFSSGHRFFHGEEPLESDGARVISCLCLHPIGYYASTRCGALVPTDDVLAHVLLMRADEKLYWKRSNQHSPHLPEAGLW